MPGDFRYRARAVFLFSSFRLPHSSGPDNVTEYLTLSSAKFIGVSHRMARVSRGPSLISSPNTNARDINCRTKSSVTRRISDGKTRPSPCPALCGCRSHEALPRGSQGAGRHYRRLGPLNWRYCRPRSCDRDAKGRWLTALASDHHIFRTVDFRCQPWGRWSANVYRRRRFAAPV
jgi:hypothetical protein